MSRTATMTAAVAPAPLSSSAAASASPSARSLLASFIPRKSTRIVSRQELADNCGIGSDSGLAWVSLHGHVFDITNFSKIHPGGPSIRLAAGRDATCLVESYHPATSIARVEAALMSKAEYVGTLALEAGSSGYVRPKDAFFLDVRARVDDLIYRQLGSHRYAYEAVGQFEAIATFLLYGYACYQVAVHGSWLWTLALGFLTGRMGFLMHMGNHCATSHYPTINRIIGWSVAISQPAQFGGGSFHYLHDAHRFMDLIGSNCTIWGYEHQVAHHVEPNEYKKDNDCEIGAPAVRMHPEIPHTPTQQYQHIIVPIAMTIGFFKWYVGDFEHFVRKQVGNVRMAIDRRDWNQLLGFKFVWLLIHVVAPVYYQGVGLAAAQCLVFMGLGGHYLENIFIVNHIQNGFVPPPDAHWAEKQMVATANWQSGSVFWNWVSGGLNHQVEHHLFPSLSQYWYPHIAATVAQACRDHGIPYQNYADFTSAWVAMWTYLRDVGDLHFVSKTGQKGAPPAEQKKAN